MRTHKGQLGSLTALSATQSGGSIYCRQSVQSLSLTHRSIDLIVNQLFYLLSEISFHSPSKKKKCGVTTTTLQGKVHNVLAFSMI